MPANTSPIFPVTPKVNFGVIATANTALDGTGTVVPVFTAGANGARADRLFVRHFGTNVATVLRLFLNNGGTNATATNNTLVFEQTIAANTLSQVTSSIGYDIDLSTLPLPSGYVINATIGTTIAAGIAVTVIGGDY